MTNTKYRLPPRKWYTLEQAVKQIYKLTGEELEIVDLIHYWLNGHFHLATNIFINAYENIYRLGSENISIEQIRYFYNTTNDLSIKKECSGDEIVGENNFFRAILIDNEHFSNNKIIKRIEFLPTPINIYKNHLISQEAKSYFNNASILSQVFILKNNMLSFEGKLQAIIKAEGIIYLRGIDKNQIDRFMFYNENISFLNIEEYILENGIPLALIPEFYQNDYKWEKAIFIPAFLDIYADIHLNINELFVTNDDISDFIKFKDLKIENSFSIKTGGNTGRPKHSIKSLVLDIAKETFKYNPNHSRNKLASEIFDYLEKEYFSEYGSITLRTINDYLKEANIGNPKGRNSSKVNIKDPFKE